MKALIILLFSSLCFVNPNMSQANSKLALLSAKDDINVDTEKSFGYYDTLGFTYYDAGHYQEADSIFELALNLKYRLLDPNDFEFVLSYLAIGNVKYMQANFKLALSNYNKALKVKVLPTEPNNKIILRIYKNIALVYSKNSKVDSTLVYLNKNLNLRIKMYGKDNVMLGGIYSQLGIAYNNARNYQKAIEVFQKSVAIRLKSLPKNDERFGESYFGLGFAYQELNQNYIAIDFFLKALKIKLNNYDKNQLDIADIYNNLCILYFRKGDRETSLAYSTKALKVQIIYYGEDHPALTKPYNNLGVIRQKFGDFGSAKLYFLKALQLKQKYSKQPDDTLFLYLLNNGSINYSLGQIDSALFYFLEAEDVLESLSSPRKDDLAWCYHYISGAYIKKNMPDTAKVYNDKAYYIRKDLYDENHKDVAASIEHAGLIFRKMGANDTALYLLNKAYLIKKEILSEFNPALLSSLQNLANQYEKIGKGEIADSIWHTIIPKLESHIFTNYINMSAYQRLNYLNIIYNLNSNFLAFAAKYNSDQTSTLATNYLLKTKSIALDFSVSTEKIIQQINDPTLTKLNKKVHNLTDSIASVKQEALNVGTIENAHLLALTEERDLLAMKVGNHPKLKSKLNISDINWKEIQAKLSSDEVAIEFFKAYDKSTDKQDSSWIYYAIIIKKDQNFPHFIKTTDEATLKQFLKVEDHVPAFVQNRRLRNQLSKELWTNLEPFIQDVKTLHISPTGFLFNLPFESLQDSQLNDLSELYSFRYYTSLRNLKKVSPTKQTYKDILLIGDLAYGSKEKLNIPTNEGTTLLNNSISQIKRNGINPLPHTRIEINTIKKISSSAGLSVRLLTGTEATEQALYQNLNNKSPDILHFATHGVSATSKINEQEGQYISSEDPMQKSALLMSGANEVWLKNERIKNNSTDNLLTALEVTNLNLQHTKLVVLSACKTGLGEGYNLEGIFGLQRAFKIAGVENVMVSLWDVNDKATQDLMTNFYNYLIKENQASSIALRNAKSQLKEAGYEPADWAGFILIE